MDDERWWFVKSSCQNMRYHDTINCYSFDWIKRDKVKRKISSNMVSWNFTQNQIKIFPQFIMLIEFKPENYQMLINILQKVLKQHTSPGCRNRGSLQGCRRRQRRFWPDTRNSRKEIFSAKKSWQHVQRLWKCKVGWDKRRGSNHWKTYIWPIAAQ